ncbi:MAG: PSD1 domain-containing protein [Planctomycetales bacterium]|nr:PSD1 domain-containing protein [Planctomycetales bacterium]
MRGVERHVPWRRTGNGPATGCWLTAVFAASLSLVVAAGELRGESPIDFNRQIRPILSNHCFQCHGPDASAREADLRLDTAAGAAADLGGHAAIVPGKPGESELVRRIRSGDRESLMPPPALEKPLSPEQKQLLAQWIEQGASYRQHWAFEPLRRTGPPSQPTPTREAAGDASNPIDAFVLTRLDALKLQSAPIADRRTLIRRVYLDLLGLPPTPAEVERFVRDDRPGAYERMVDATLSSPRFGERWGRHWLDQARYADSHGYTNDNERSMWPYRDWVIEAFNRDLPFDRFTLEQLAGDLLPEPTRQQIIATGFHRNTLINSEGGTKADQFRDEQVKDRVDTTGLVWMALTVGCAKCHSHKYDPITQREYYQLYAFFNSTADANSETPLVEAPSASQSERLARLSDDKTRLAKQLEHDPGRPARQRDWEQRLPQLAAEEPKSDQPPFPWQVLKLSGKSLQGAELHSQADESLLVSGVVSAEEEYHATTFSPLTKIRSVRLEVLPDASLPQQGPGRAEDGNFVLSEFWFRTGDGRELRFSKAFAEHSQGDFDVSLAVDGKQDTGWSIGEAPEGALNRARVAWFVLPKTLEVELEHALTFKMQFHDKRAGHALGRFRISISSDVWIDRPTPRRLAPLAMLAPERRSDLQQRKLDEAFLAQDPVLGPVKQSLETAEREYDELQRSIPTTMVMQELDKPRETHVQIRGDFLRTSDPVRADVPDVLPRMAAETTAATNEGKGESVANNRLQLAEWLAQPDHPLTARVRVNRIWMRLFGRGLVETDNDFGVQGAPPTHPELLDWLASEFMRQQWSTKQLLRTIMLSSTYRRSSQVSEAHRRLDPKNDGLARQNRVRVEAEIVRDLALAVSGQLGTTIGGPSVYPPQPEGVYAFTQRQKAWTTSEGEGRYRRGMYTFFYRSAPYPMLSTFDAPKFNATCTRRDRSNTPLQSLTVANSEAMFELASLLGARLLREVPAPAPGERADEPSELDVRRLRRAYQLCFSRDPSESELQHLEQYLQKCRGRFADDQSVWGAVSRVLMNLDEFITRE